MQRWRYAMDHALYGDQGFFRTQDPADHFRTSAGTGHVFAGAIATLLQRVDESLGRPERLDFVDIGAGRGDLVRRVMAIAPDGIRERLNPIAVEIATAPDGLDPAITWLAEPPRSITGLVTACEWLDNVPLDVATDLHYLDVDSAGLEATGQPLDQPDHEWLRTWWPEGERVEIGSTRDTAWTGVLTRMRAGLAVAIDYGHLRAHRPALGTLTAFRAGHEVPPVPDGTCDLTAHVAVDAVASAGSAVAGLPAQVVRQADALRALGLPSGRPDLDLAGTDPAGYLRALAAASIATELTDPTGLGDHFWIEQPVAIRWAT